MYILSSKQDIDENAAAMVHNCVRNYLVFGILTRHAHRPGVIENFMMSEFEKMIKESTNKDSGVLKDQPYYYAKVSILAELTFKSQSVVSEVI